MFRVTCILFFFISYEGKRVSFIKGINTDELLDASQDIQIHSIIWVLRKKLSFKK